MEELPRVPVPEECEVDVPLRDGSTVHLRPIRPDDDGMMIALFNRFSPRTIYLRFHHVIGEMTKEMSRSIRGFPLLDGWRGAEPGDLEALEDLLLRVSAMVEDLPEIAEMDFNPIKVLSPGRGCVVVDARVLLRRI